MVQIHIWPLSENQEECILLELQGSIERTTEQGTPLHLGQLCWRNDIPYLLLGQQRLTGQWVTLQKPLAILEKCPLEDTELSDVAANKVKRSNYRVKCIIKKKILFKSRPEALMSAEQLARHRNS